MMLPEQRKRRQSLLPENNATERNIVISDLLLRFNFISQIILYYLLSALKYHYVLIIRESILKLYFRILLYKSELHQSFLPLSYL